MSSFGFDRDVDTDIVHPAFLFFFCNCIVPLIFLLWEVLVAFPREIQLRQSPATQSMMHAGCFSFHNPPNSDMDCRIFNVHVDVNACDFARGYTDTVIESALKIDCG